MRLPLREVLDFLFPPICPVCEGRLASGKVCDECWEELLKSQVFEPKQYFGFRVYSLFRYRGRVREAIERMKYGGMRVLAELFAEALSEYLRVEAPDIIVPLPLHPARIRERGFSQTRVIAEALGRELGIPVKRVIYRRRYTKPQALLKAEERATNVEGAFACLKALNGERVVLVDDVITTGNTFYQAASALLDAGAGEVVGATLARG